MGKIELLAPAGNMECLETAFYFGADAAYIGGKSFGLRAFAGNFDEKGIIEALEKAHFAGKKIYVTANAVMYNAEMGQLEDYICFLADAGVDGIIISDPSVIEIVRKNGLDVPIHLSTQVNTQIICPLAFGEGTE
jgi:putative protease